MNIEVKYKPIIGYFLIYFMLLWNQTNFGTIYLEKFTIPILILFMILLFFKSIKLSKWCSIISILLIGAAFFVRFTVGGIGIQAVTLRLSCIYISAFTIVYNKEEIINRFLKTVVFLTTISIMLWGLCLIVPHVYTSLVPSYKSLMTYKLYYDDITFDEINYICNGFFLYTYRQVDSRNVSIFTEPGIYQMVINTAIFIILFMSNYIYLKHSKLYLVILFVGLATTQSTTGFIGLGLILMFYLIYKKDNLILEKKLLAKLIVLSSFLILLDYIIRGNESIIYIAVIEKLFSSGSLSLTHNSSSAARVGTILLTLQSMAKHPFGIGYTNLELLLDTPHTGFVAAEILSFGAVWGVIPLILVLLWYFYPFKNKLSNSTIILFALLFINTLLAQSRLFYPVLVLIPLALKYDCLIEYNSNNNLNAESFTC